MRCQSRSLSATKSKSPAGCCIAEACRFTEFVELFAALLRRRSIFRARRKRSRPLIAAAYPDLPEAGQSGFLLLLELPIGRSEITIQVQDHRKIWRTIFVTDIWAFPLTFLGRIGLPRVERFLSTYLAQLFVGNRQNTPRARSSHTRSASLKAVCLARGSKGSGVSPVQRSAILER